MRNLVDPITITSANLKCDADGCGYEEKDVGLSPEHIGKCCPRCGANLLTAADYKAALALVAAYASINAEIGPVAESGNAIRFSVNPRAA